VRIGITASDDIGVNRKEIQDRIDAGDLTGKREESA